VAAEFGVPAERCFVAGLSAGGAMVAVLSEVYPDVFAAARS
jgi:poly(3-hydroxybutyrate) depolymerase